MFYMYISTCARQLRIQVFFKGRSGVGDKGRVGFEVKMLETFLVNSRYKHNNKTKILVI